MNQNKDIPLHLSRTLVVGRTIPVQATGTSLVTRKLLEHFCSDDIIFLGRTPDARRRIRGMNVNYPAIEIPAPPQGGRGERYWVFTSVIPGIVLGLVAILRYHPKVILSIYPDEGALLTGFLLSRLTGLPLVAYFCDLYAEEVKTGWQGAIARRLQPIIFRHSARILALTNGIVNYYQDHYGIEATLIPHCINSLIPIYYPLPPPSNPFRIAYSGNVNASRLDALRELVAVVGEQANYELYFFSPTSQGKLEKEGLWNQRTHLSFIQDYAELNRQLMNCDVFYLPVAFNPIETSYEELLTGFGTKTFEYFTSQRPILLHSPDEYFINQFFNKNHCGLIVNRKDRLMLFNALETLRTDLSLREQLVQNALITAQQFEGSCVALGLRNTLEEVIQAY